MNNNYKNKPINQFIWSWIEKKNINKTQTVFVTAKSDKVILEKLYKNLNIIYIYNFPSLKIKSSKKELLRKKINIENNKKIFLYQGALQEGRGIKIMIKLLEDFDNAVAVIIGEGEYYKILKKYAIAKKVINRTHFIDKVPYKNLLELTSGADIGFCLVRPISLSYHNALPNKIFEYAICGLPSIVDSKFKAIHDYVIEKNIGLVVDDWTLLDLESLSNIRNFILSNRKSFSMESDIYRLIDFYQALL